MAEARTRDAGRSRERILDAAESLFAERGFDGVSLSEIGAAAGLSRATPSYFFGSKEQLYAAVVQRVFAARQAATAEAVEPLVEWSERGGDLGELRSALRLGMERYMAFLLGRPTFQRFITWEELAGAKRLRDTPRSSTALTDAFTSVRGVAEAQGLRPFQVDDAVLLWVALIYAPLAHSNTLLVAINRDLQDPEVRERHLGFAVDQMMHLLAE